jgi:thioredoxin 1
MPTFLIFRNGREIERIRGADSRGLTSAVQKAVKGASPASGASFASGGRKLGDSASASKYISGGNILSSLPLPAQATHILSSVASFLGLYLITLFSFDAMGAAESSRFNVNNKAPPADAAAKR